MRKQPNVCIHWACHDTHIDRWCRLSLAQCHSIRKTLVTASWICRGHKARQKTCRELLQQWLTEFGGAAASPAVTVPVTALSGGS